VKFTPGNQVTLLRNGTEYFPALEQAIDAATSEIQMQCYIFEDDEAGILIAAALKRAAQRNVDVCVLLDGFGSKDTPKKFFDEMRLSGVRVLIYRPKISPWTFKRHRLRRLHSKISVMDGTTAFVGGINIIDDMNAQSMIPPRVDYAVKVQGPVVGFIHHRVRHLWRWMAWLRWHMHPPMRTVPTPSPAAGHARAAFVYRDNALHRKDIEAVYLAAIRNAKSEIIIANAYFLPGLRFRHALSKASRRGVRVVLLLQAQVEFWLLNHASKALYASFLQHGIEIHEYQKSHMHSKVAVIDGRWATVGSSNIDPFSLMLAHEANVVVDDADFASLLRNDLEIAMQSGSRKLVPASWKRKGLISRAMAWIGYSLVRLIMGMVGIGERNS
jgi:cardiolipin synthase A/B